MNPAEGEVIFDWHIPHHEPAPAPDVYVQKTYVPSVNPGAISDGSWETRTGTVNEE